MRLYVPDLVQEHSRVQVDQTTLRIHALQVAKQLVPSRNQPRGAYGNSAKLPVNLVVTASGNSRRPIHV